MVQAEKPGITFRQISVCLKLKSFPYKYTICYLQRFCIFTFQIIPSGTRIAYLTALAGIDFLPTEIINTVIYNDINRTQTCLLLMADAKIILELPLTYYWSLTYHN